MPYIYGNNIDLTPDLAKQYGALGYKVTNDASKVGAGDIVLGGSGATGGIADNKLNGAIRLAGLDRGATAQAANTYLSNLQGQQSQPVVYDPTNDIKAMAAAQKQAALAGLQKSRDQSLSDISAAKAQIEPAFYTQRNNASTDSQIAARNFAEYMAQHGQNSTGANGSMAQSNLANNVALQGNLGALGTAEAGAYAQNAKQATDVNTAYNSDVASTSAGIDASMLQNLINAQQTYNAQKLAQSNTDRAFNYQVGRDNISDTGYLPNGQQTLTGQQVQSQLKASQSQLEGQNIQNQLNALTLKYQPQIIQGQIDEQSLRNAYQQLVNQGYNAQQAADLALKYAQLNKINSSGSGGGSGGYSFGGPSSTNNGNNGAEMAWTSLSNTLGNNPDLKAINGALDWLTQNKSGLTSDVGSSEYKKMYDTVVQMQQNYYNTFKLSRAE